MQYKMFKIYTDVFIKSSKLLFKKNLLNVIKSKNYE